MYEAKYKKYITKSTSRFAEKEEISAALKPIRDPGGRYSAGVPLECNGDTILVDATDNHTIGIGPSGCKKSRTAVFTTALSVISAGESAVINDPKGEIYRRTAALAKKKRAVIKVLNFRKPSFSHHWNPLMPAYHYAKAENNDAAIECLAEFVGSIVAPGLKNTNDRYWQDSAREFLLSVCLLLIATENPKMINIHNLIPFCYEDSYPALKAVLRQMDDSHPAAAGLHAVVDLAAERTRSCVYGSLLAMLGPFLQNEGLQEMLSGDTFDLADIAKKQVIVYLIYPDEKQSMDFLVNMFLTQCYEVLINCAAEAENDRLPIRCNFILDEFSNLTPIERFSNRISEARSKNIRYFLFVQSYGQLKEKYGDEADSILANCNNWLCWSSKDVSFLKTVSAICGNEIDFNGIEHPLIAPSEMQLLKKLSQGAEVLVLRQGLYPYVAFLPDVDYIKQFRNLPAAGKPLYMESCSNRLFDVDEWVKMLGTGEIPMPYPKNGAA